MTNKSEKTVVALEEETRVVERRKTWMLWSWWVELCRKSAGKELFIRTEEDYEKIWVNGEVVWKRSQNPLEK